MLSSYNLRTQTRLWMGFLREADRGAISRIPRIALSKDEVKGRLGYRYEKDERRCFKLLAECGSVSWALFLERNLSRAVVKSALKELFYNRKLHVT